MVTGKVRNIWGLVRMTFGQIHDCYSLLEGRPFLLPVKCTVTLHVDVGHVTSE